VVGPQVGHKGVGSFNKKLKKNYKTNIFIIYEKKKHENIVIKKVIK
jgi:hypothetical protein